MYVVTHKPIDFPIPDYCRKIQVNAEANGQWPGCLHDNDNPDNISRKNLNYAELTALYSMWKNCDADIQGLYHYRRYMVSKLFGESYRYDARLERIAMYTDEIITRSLSQQEIIAALQDSDIILTCPSHYAPKNVYEGMGTFFPVKLMEALREAVKQFCPDYYPAFQEVLKADSLSVCQMFIAPREIVDAYCSWLFGLLSKTEKILKSYNEYSENARIIAYMGEPLLNVYVVKNGLKVKYFYKGFIPNDGKFRRALKKIPYLIPAVRALRKLKSRLTAHGA